MSHYYLNICYKKYSRLASLMLIVISASFTSVNAGPFDEGSTNATIAIGSGQVYTEDYLIIGAGIGHFLTHGLEVSLDVNAWTGGEPSLYELTPKLTYVVDNQSGVLPYLGVFYNRTFIEDLDDSDSYGYRAGFYSPIGGRTFVGIGLVYTELQDCTETIFVSCSDTYSELTFMFSI